MAIRVQNSDSIKIRIARLSWLVAACYVVLVARLIYLQAIHGQYYSVRAKAMREKQLTQTAERGAILDRAGKPMAVTIHASALICNQNQVKNAARTAEAASRILGVGAPEVLPYFKKPANSVKGKSAVILPYEVTPQVMSRFRWERAKPG